jgi:hypothetical protein
MSKLLSVGSDSKTIKGETLGYTTAILYLAPHKLSGVINVCAHASEKCIFACLNTAGLGGVYTSIQKARIDKTVLFAKDQKAFILQLVKEIKSLSKKHGAKFAVRLNGTSDLPWENIKVDGKNIFETLPDITFYDYTKNPKRMYLDIPNYHLTFSRSETFANHLWCKKLIKDGKNVAVVFDKETYLQALKVDSKFVDGDKTDLRFLDPAGVIVALKAKGKAKKSEAGDFVVSDLNNL